MPRSLALVVQSLGLIAAVTGAVFAPQPGRASQLLPIPLTASQDPAGLTARWAAREDAQLLAFDAQQGRAIVIAPSAFSLMRALSYGLVPIIAETPSCTAAKDGRRNDKPNA